MKKNAVALSIAFIIIMAFAVRAYHFEDWLYFKMDQSRDAFLINNVLENGPGYLPLLGPRAGATELENGFLRLGPIFYYFQYLSALIFNSGHPDVLAYPELFFSIGAIAMVFLLAKIYFDRFNSLLITAMYAFSFLVIQYSRFSWNPNSLQFFLLLSFYGLLRFLPEKRFKKSLGWLTMWAVGLIIGSQLHFFGFFSLLGISGLLILFDSQFWKKGKIKEFIRKEFLKKMAVYASVFLLVFLVFYSPVIISDIKEGGQNSKNFIEAFSAKPVKKPLSEKISEAVKENSRYYCMITTSECYKESTSIRKYFLPFLFSGIVVLAGVLLSVLGMLGEKDRSRRNFLALVVFWVAVFSVLTIPVSFQLRPRFFIVVFAIPFISVGLISEYLVKKFGKRLKEKSFLVPMVLAAIILAANVRGTYAWFVEQSRSQTDAFDVERTLVLKNKDGVTLGQLQEAADWIYERHQAGKNLYYYVKPEHVRPIDFLLSEKNVQAYNMELNGDSDAEYFAITPTESGLSPVTKKFKREMVVLEKKQFGQITAYRIDFPGRVIDKDFILKDSGGSEDRLYWKDVYETK